MFRRIIRGLRRRLAPAAPQKPPCITPHNIIDHNYKRDWVSPEGKDYRKKVYERQRDGRSSSLENNPSILEIQNALRASGAKKILEVGCGWGRLMEKFEGEFEVEGCDVSREMLDLCNPPLKVFYLNLAEENMSFLRSNFHRWDAIYMRGVMMYIMDDPRETVQAMNNMMMLASKKIIVWEWPEVCERMKLFSDSPKFEYHSIVHTKE
jgi:SAM-dependent methyltransferase